MPSVRRSCPITGSLPSTVTIKPSAPGEQSLDERRLDQPGHHRQRQHEEREELPGAELQRELRRAAPVAAMRNTAPSSPPMNEAQMPSQSARPGSPLRAMG